MKKITFVNNAYGTIQVGDDCPDDPQKAMEYLDHGDMWHEIEWSAVDDASYARVAFIDDGEGEPTYEESLLDILRWLRDTCGNSFMEAVVDFAEEWKEECS